MLKQPGRVLLKAKATVKETGWDATRAARSFAGEFEAQHGICVAFFVKDRAVGGHVGKDGAQQSGDAHLAHGICLVCIVKGNAAARSTQQQIPRVLAHALLHLLIRPVGHRLELVARSAGMEPAGHELVVNRLENLLDPKGKVAVFLF